MIAYIEKSRKYGKPRRMSSSPYESLKIAQKIPYLQDMMQPWYAWQYGLTKNVKYGLLFLKGYIIIILTTILTQILLDGNIIIIKLK